MTVDKPVAGGAEPGRNPTHPKAFLGSLGQLWVPVLGSSCRLSLAAMWLCHQEMEALSCCTAWMLHTSSREKPWNHHCLSSAEEQANKGAACFSPQGLNTHV